MSQIAGGNGMPDNMEQGVNRREFFKSAFVELTKVVLEFSGAGGDLEPVDRMALMQRAHDKEITVIDVRPHEEYQAGHIPGARSVPL
ncbi:MAG: rhodanese-like domain-containing protein, partial [Nitrospirota bacterium]|nr:rhodanese-like domain-containing protein [Nitrospirota bacterium]